MKKLFRSMLCAYKLWKMGYFLSENTDKEKDGCEWGFIRLNFDNGRVNNYGVIDWDFRVGNKEEFSHNFVSLGNSEKTFHRWDEE